MRRDIEVGVVQQVEELTPQLQAMPFTTERNTLAEGKIEIAKAGAGKDVSSFGAEGRTERLGGWLGKCALVKPVLRCPYLGRGLATRVGSHQ